MSHQDPNEKGGLQGAALRGMRLQNEADKQTLAVLRGLLESIQEDPFQNTERLVQRAIADLSGAPITTVTAPPALSAHGGTANPARGSVARLASASLFSNPNPWVATCAGCQQTKELGCGTLTLPQDLEAIGWHNSLQFGYLCPDCKPLLISSLGRPFPATCKAALLPAIERAAAEARKASAS